MAAVNASYFIDTLSIIAVYFVLAGAALLLFELGFRIGRWWQTRTPDEKEGSTRMLVGSLLALLGFLLAFTIGMATDRFDTRLNLVLSEANAIGTTYLRAGYLPQPASDDIRTLLREYIPRRIIVPDNDVVAADSARSVEIQGEIWAMTEELARQNPDSDVLAVYIESLNPMIDLQTTRFVAGVYARVPETVIYLLLIGGALTIGMVGYNAGLTRKRSLASAIIVIVVLVAVVSLIIDLDRPRDGLLKVDQRALIDLQNSVQDLP
ncbi:MAG TPA: hypothetical protein VER79_02000 [Candidatus Limnocylindrales bacterium]|nr:hypothetical protein [Candidatus Limnocylindrales bacterium]